MAEESRREDAAILQFWAMPELVRFLLPYLDLESTASLAHSKVMDISVLQGTIDWDKLIRRKQALDGLVGLAEAVETLVGILKLMEERTTSLLDLLDLICEKSYAPPMMERRTEVQIVCPRHPESRVIQFHHFQLLEEIESAFGSTLQSVEFVKDESGTDPFQSDKLASLSSRLSRQQQKMNAFHGCMIDIQNKESAEDFRRIMQNCEEFKVSHSLGIDKIGQEGWEAVAEGLRLHPGVVWELQTSKKDMDGGNRDDLRKIYDSLDTTGTWSIIDGNMKRQMDEYIDKRDGEAAWTRLVQILELSEEEWQAELWRALEEET